MAAAVVLTCSTGVARRDYPQYCRDLLEAQKNAPSLLGWEAQSRKRFQSRYLAPSDVEVERSIAQLASPRASVRDSAEQELRRYGPGLLNAPRFIEATVSRDAEVKFRTERISRVLSLPFRPLGDVEFVQCLVRHLRGDAHAQAAKTFLDATRASLTPDEIGNLETIARTVQAVPESLAQMQASAIERSVRSFNSWSLRYQEMFGGVMRRSSFRVRELGQGSALHRIQLGETSQLVRLQASRQYEVLSRGHVPLRVTVTPGAQDGRTVAVAGESSVGRVDPSELTCVKTKLVPVELALPQNIRTGAFALLVARSVEWNPSEPHYPMSVSWRPEGHGHTSIQRFPTLSDGVAQLYFLDEAKPRVAEEVESLRKLNGGSVLPEA